MVKKKKIGIVTLHAIANYGGILQAYALQIVLERMGYEAEKIELSMWRKQLTRFQKLWIYPYRMFQKKILKKSCIIKKEEHQYESGMAKYDRAMYTMPFINTYIKRKQIYSYIELNQDDYEALIVGSDQIWRPRYIRDANADIRDSYLQFAKGWDVKRIAYAASFGTNECEYTPSELKDCGELLEKFDAVSVREESGIQLCAAMGRADVCQLVDPTLLLNKEDYIKLIPDNYPKSEGDLLCYVLDKTGETGRIIQYVAQQLNLRLFEVISNPMARTNKEDGYYQPPVEKWLQGFKDAKFVVTDSFHACVFSILFGKPFIVIGNQERGMARYQTLLKMFRVEERLILTYDKQTIDKILQTAFMPEMDGLNRERDKARTYIHEQLQRT